ncbi:MAG: hypothetical protein R6U66_10255 [Bacteroidales bacterium]
MFTSLREKIGNYLLEKRAKDLEKKRSPKVTNFSAAKTAGVLFTLGTDEEFKTIKSFLNYLIEQDINVIALGYYPGKEIPEAYLLRKGFNFYCQEDLNWVYLPQNNNVEKFIAPQLDLFVDLTLTKQLATSYVARLSKSTFKVGAKEVNERAYDLFFDIEKDRTIQNLIQQITHYVGNFQ